MFRQVKSALFWYYLFKFRKRVILIALLLLIAFFANAIYSDVVEYLTLKKRLEFLELVLLGKWLIIIFNIVFSIYLVLTMFKKEKFEQEKEEQKKAKSRISIFKKNTPNNKENDKKNKEEEPKKEKFSAREKEFLYKKKLKNEADILVEK